MNIGDKAPEILGKDEQGRDIRIIKFIAKNNNKTHID